MTPYTSTLGQQLKNTWVWTGSVFQYYNKNGVKETISTLVKEAKAAGTYTGYFAINGEYYCLDKNGRRQEMLRLQSTEFPAAITLKKTVPFREECSMKDGNR